MKATSIKVDNKKILIVSDDDTFDGLFAPEYIATSPEGYVYGWGDDEDDALESAIENWKEKWIEDEYPEFTVFENGERGFDL